MRIRAVLPLLIGVGAGCLISDLSAASLKQAMLLDDTVTISEGKPFPRLRPLFGKPYIWREPFTNRAEMTVYFPYRDGVELSRFSANCGFERVRKFYLFRRTADGRWLETASNDKLDFSFADALKTDAVRIVAIGISNRDHDILQFRDFNAEGKALGPEFDDSQLLQLRCDAEDNVFDLSDSWLRADRLPKVAVTVTNTDKEPRDLELRGRFDHYAGGVAESCPPVRLRLEPGQTYHGEIAMRGKRPGPYIAIAEVVDANRGNFPRASQGIVVGLRDPRIADGSKAPEKFVSPGMRRGEAVRDFREQLKSSGTMWSSDLSHCLGGAHTVGDGYFKKMADNGVELGMAINTYHDFEPLPGVYNFEWCDRIVDAAGRHRFGLEFGLWTWDFNSQFWLRDTLRRGLNGKTSGGWNGIGSLFSEKFRRHVVRASEVMVQRYGDCPEVWLWALHPYGMVDHDTVGIYDLHPEALQAFRGYLSKKYRSIEKLNDVYGTQYVSFDAVPVPEARSAQLKRDGKHAESVTVLDVRPEWRDYLDFYHAGTVKFRDDLARMVRQHDTKRGLSGMNASGGVGDADGQLRSLSETGGFYGDQALNMLHYFRRLVSARRYQLPLRHEDIAAVNIGRGVKDAADMTKRCNWDVFQSTMLGLAHFNFVFSAWEDNEFWDTVFTNSRIKAMIKNAYQLEGVFVKAGFLHSFLSDVYTGNYHYQGISVYRWWLMNAMNAAMLADGRMFEPFTDFAGLAAIDGMQLMLDDGSGVLPEAMVERLEAFVRHGGKLVLTARSGEFCPEYPGQPYRLLQRLGYEATGMLRKRNPATAMVTFSAGNGVFQSLKTLALNNVSALRVPPGGREVGLIGDVPGAVLWRHGKGEVLLFAGQFGANEEVTLAGLTGNTPEDQKACNAIWESAEVKLVKQFRPLLAELTNWAQVKGAYRLSENCYSMLRHRGDGEYLLAVYNQLPEAKRMEFALPGLKSDYQVLTITLAGEANLGVKTAAELAAGITLPEIPQDRFLGVRLLKR